MRIFVYEFVTGGGCAGTPVSRQLVREGLAMRTALLEDLSAIGRHAIVCTTDARFARRVPSGVEMIPVDGCSVATIEAVVNASDAVWLIAPETGRCLERLAARIERSGRQLLGSGAAAVRAAADKTSLPRRLARIGVRHPETSLIGPGMNAGMAARRIGYPVVVKPARGAACHGVRLARHAGELRGALAAAHGANGMGPLVMQRYLRGRAASVSLLADGRHAVPLAVNAQRVTAAAAFSYRGGSTPLEHPLAAAAAEMAAQACTGIPGLRGFVGVDLVLTDAGPVVIEVNPRLTMAYLGVRAVINENLAAMALDACEGRLPAPPAARRRARFTAAGRVVST